MKKKLIILIALVFAFAFTLSACGDTETEETAAPEKVTATATVLTQEVYDKYIGDNKDSDTFREDDGFIKYTSSIGELACLWKIGDVVPFMMTFEKSVDGDRADEIVQCMEMSAVQ